MASEGFGCCRRIGLKEDELKVVPGIIERAFALECITDDEVS